MKAFKTAAQNKKAKDKEEPAIEFEHDGRVIKARRPKDAAYVLLVAASMGDRSGVSSAVEITRFLESVLSEDDVEYFTKRLRDPDDTFDLGGEGGLLEVFNHIVAELTGRPTESQPD